jgi:hypothetical protein
MLNKLKLELLLLWDAEKVSAACWGCWLGP